MIMADVLKWALLIVGTQIVFVSYWLAAQALFPQAVERARGQYSRPWKLTLLGLLMSAPLIAIGIFTFQRNNPVFKIIGGGLILLPVVIGLVGSTGLNLRIGTGLPSPLDAGQPWRRVLRGSVVLVLMFLLPVIGWFVLLPWTLITGFAAAALSCSGKAKPEPTAAPPLASLKEVAG